MARHQEPLDREQVRQLEAKLERCRNQENNPDSEVCVKEWILDTLARFRGYL